MITQPTDQNEKGLNDYDYENWDGYATPMAMSATANDTILTQEEYDNLENNDGCLGFVTMFVVVLVLFLLIGVLTN